MGARAPLVARAAAIAYVAFGAYGISVAIDEGEAARFAGLTYPGPVTTQFAWIGTGLSAPLPILAGYTGAAISGNRRALALLAGTTLLGQLGEPLTWRGRGRARAWSRPPTSSCRR